MLINKDMRQTEYGPPDKLGTGLNIRTDASQPTFKTIFHCQYTVVTRIAFHLKRVIMAPQESTSFFFYKTDYETEQLFSTVAIKSHFHSE